MRELKPCDHSVWKPFHSRIIVSSTLARCCSLLKAFDWHTCPTKMRFTGIVAFVTATCLTVTPANAAGCIGCAPSAPKEYDCAVEIRHKELEEPFLEIHAKFNDVIPIGVGLETRRIWLWQCSVLCDDVPAYWILKTWAVSTHSTPRFTSCPSDVRSFTLSSWSPG